MKKSNHIKVFEDFASGMKNPQTGSENDVLEMDLDFGYDSDTDMALFLQDCIKKYQLTITRLNLRGPGGGGPQVFLVGLRKNLRRMLEENGFEDIEYHLEIARPFDLTTLKDFRGM